MSNLNRRPQECAECPLWWWGVTVIVVVILLIVMFGIGDLSAQTQTQTVTGDKLRIGPSTVTASAAEVRIGEDGSNYCDITISATGQLTLDCTGAGAGYVLPDVLNIQNTISNSAGSVTIDDPLIVTGTSDLRGTIFNTDATVTVDDALGVTGTTSLNGAVNIGDAAGDNIDVNGTLVSDLIFTDNTYDIGKSGATRPRHLYLSGNAVIGGTTTFGGNIISNLLFTDNSYDIGASGATRPRHFYLAGNAVIGGTTSFGGNIISNVLFTDNTYDIGASGATRPRHLYVAQNGVFGGDVQVNGGDLTTSSVQLNITPGGSANLKLNPGGDVEFDPTGNDLLPTTSYDLNIGMLSKKFLTLHAAELWVETLVAQNTIATIGGRILVGPTTSLTTDLAAATPYVCVKHNEMASGDRTYMEANGSVEFFAITSGPTTDHANCNASVTDYYYSVTRNLDGTGANDWSAGDAMFNTGTTGEGFIDLYSLRGVKAATEYGPTIVGNYRNSATYNDWSPRWAIGNLNGVYGYSGTSHGAAFGDYGNAHITVDNDNGIRFRDSTTVKGQILNDGTFWFGDYNGGAGAGYIQWTGSALNVKGAITVTAGSNVADTDLSNLNANALDNLEDGTTYKKTTANQVTGAGRAYTALDSSNRLVTAVIPATSLTPSGAGLYLGANYMGYFASGSVSGDGLAGTYYNDLSGTSPNVTYSGASCGTNTLTTINFSGSLPHACLSVGTWMASWVGYVKPSYSETYTFYCQSDDGCRIYLDTGGGLTERTSGSWVDRASTETATAGISLTANEYYPVKVEYYDWGGSYDMAFRWYSASTTKAVVPQSALFTTSGSGTWSTYTDSSGNFYLGGSSGVLQWNASTSTLKLGDASNEHLELSGSVTKWNNGATTMASLGGSPSTLTLGEDANNKTRLTIDSTNGFKVIRDSGGTDATAFQIDTSGYIWLDAADHVSTFADVSQIKWDVPAATGETNIAARYYDSTNDVVSLRLYAKAGSSGGTADVGQVQLLAYGGSVLSGQATLQATEGSESIFQLVVTRLELSGSSTGASINDYWDDYVNIADGIEATGAIRERGRTTGMGEWIAVTHNDANFYANTGDHWTVASGDQIAYAYTLVGTTMTVAFQIDQSDIVTSTPTYLQLKVPASKTIQRNAIASVRVLDQSVAAAGFAWAVNGETWIRIYSDMTGTTSGWGTTTDGAYVHGQISFEVN